MTAVPLGNVLRHVRRLSAAAEQVPDAELLRRFAAGGEAAAFAALLERHGRMVWATVRHHLRHEQDAEDAFQATFLVLARKAGSIRKGQSVGSWLHGVAYRAALRVRRDAARRRQHERRAAEMPRAKGNTGADWREVQAVLDEEVQRLPESYRTAFVACCLEGEGVAAAAQRLGWKQGTLSARLARARALLRRRLTRRGISLSAMLCAAALAPAPAGAVPAPLADATLTAALGVEGGLVSASVAAVANGVGRAVVRARLMMLAGLLLAAGAAAAGGALAHHARAVPQTAEEQPAGSAAGRTERAGVPAPRTDRYGDPLPDGALARLGTIRFRHPGQIIALALSPDGKTLATGGYPGRVCLWDAATGRLRGRLQGPPGQVLALRFCPDGSALAAAGSVSADQIGAGRVVLLDLRTGKPRFTLEHRSWARCLAFSPDGATLAVGCDRDELGLWEVASGKARPRPPGDLGPGFASVAFSPDGRLLAAGGYDMAVRLWDWRAGREVSRLAAGGAVRSLTFSADGRRLLVGQDGPHFVRLWDVAARKPLREFKGHTGWKGGLMPGCSCTVAFSPDGRTVASGGDDGAVFLWDAATGEARGSHRDQRGSVHGVIFLPDGKSLAAAGTEGRVLLLDAATGKERTLFDEHSGGLGDFALSADGKMLATASTDRTIRLWGLAGGRTVRVLRGHAQAVYSVSFSPDGRELVSGGGDGTVRLWDVATGQGRQLTDAHRWYSRAAFAPDGKLLASAGADSKVRLWGPDGRRELAQLEGHAGYIVGLSISPDGRWLATTGESYSGEGRSHEDRTVRLWDLAKRAEHRRFTRGSPYSGPQRFAPGSRTFVYGDGGTLHFVDPATGAEENRGPYTGVADFAFLAGGRWLLTLGTDRVLRIRELASGLELHRLAPPVCGMSKVAVGPGGRMLLTLNEDATVLVWDLAPPDRRRRTGAAPETADRLWADLAAADGRTAYRVVWALASGPGRAVAILRERLPGALREVNERSRRVQALVADLDSDSFERREAATRELEKLGAEAGPAMRAALASDPSPEVRKRLEKLLARAGNLRSGEALRCLRAVAVLERVATAEASKVLQTVAEGAREDWLTQEAKASLRRLSGRTAPPR